MITFITEKEYHADAINLVARFVADKALSVICTGNVADIGEECLQYLEAIAVEKEFNPVVISTYLNIIKTENDQIRDFLW